MSEWGYRQLAERYEHLTAVAVAECVLATDLLGGMTADAEGISRFVQHHLGLTGEEAAAAIKRIMAEEIGEREVSSEEGELRERLAFGVHIIRRDEGGPWLGGWMLQANLKAAASRLGIFQDQKGSKGDLSEMGAVSAYGISARSPDRLERVYLVGSDDDGPARTFFQQIKGRVQTPSGSKSIVSETETAPAGSRFAFQFRFRDSKLNESDVVDIFASAMTIGLGSGRSIGFGKFRIERLLFEAMLSGGRKRQKSENARA